MQAFSRLLNFLRQFFESDRCIHQVTQNEFGCFGFSVDEQRDRLIQQGLRKRRVTLHTSGHSGFEVFGQCHVFHP